MIPHVAGVPLRHFGVDPEQATGEPHVRAPSHVSMVLPVHRVSPAAPHVLPHVPAPEQMGSLAGQGVAAPQVRSDWHFCVLSPSQRVAFGAHSSTHLSSLQRGNALGQFSATQAPSCAQVSSTGPVAPPGQRLVPGVHREGGALAVPVALGDAVVAAVVSTGPASLDEAL